jgi:hypothetical protein
MLWRTFLLSVVSLVAAVPAVARADGVDRRLVGTWRYTHAYTPGTFTGVYEEYLTLNDDGTCTLATNAGAGARTGGVGPERRAKVKLRSQWSVSGKVIQFRWHTGLKESIPFLYGRTTDGVRMLFRGGGKKLWTKVR